jgi:hypothetical protein
MSLRLFSSFIIKTKNPCIKCINYIEYKYPNMYDEIYSNERVLGKCSLFGNENLVTGEIEYAHALVCRVDELKCGRNGKYFNTIIIQK